MNWRIEQDGEEWVVYNGDTEISRHATPGAALAALQEGVAAEDAPAVAEPTASPGRFTIPILVPAGGTTDDGRIFEQATWRTPPLPLMFQTVTDVGHFGAVWAGSIDSVDQAEDGTISAGGWYASDEASDGAGNRCRTAVAEGLRGVSMDAIAEVEEIEILEYDDDGWPIRWQARYPEYTICGATVTPIPAFHAAYIENADGTTASGETIVERSGTSDTPMVHRLAAAELVAAAVPDVPPAEWFTNPNLAELTPLTITDDGRVFGHIAAWGECHIGREDICITPPSSTAAYRYFHTGERQTTGGRVATGPITVGIGHAPLSLGARAAAAHYDDASHAVADVCAGEDDHGIWGAGAIRSGATDEQIEAARASAPSGDWRRIDGNLEMVAVLAVNVPGFPVPRGLAAAGDTIVTGPRVRLEADVCTALVAAGIVGNRPRRPVSIDAEVTALRAELDTLKRTVTQVGRQVAPAVLASAMGRVPTTQP